MKPIVAGTRARPNRLNRILVVLAAGWMLLSLALGGVVTAEPRADSGPTESVTRVAQE
jgi:preprotein translocase subunit SecG